MDACSRPLDTNRKQQVEAAWARNMAVTLFLAASNTGAVVTRGVMMQPEPTASTCATDDAQGLALAGSDTVDNLRYQDPDQ